MNIPAREVTLIEKSGARWSHAVPVDDLGAPSNTCWAVLSKPALTGSVLGRYMLGVCAECGVMHELQFGAEIVAIRCEDIIEGIMWVSNAGSDDGI